MEPASISVIIPAYNREAILGETLESLLRQTLPAREIIVVDDGSTDRTAAVAESCGAPVRVVRQSNAGPAAARNRGFRESAGEYIHFFDSDDIAVPNKHEVQVRTLEESGADIAFGPWIKGIFGAATFCPVNQVYQQHGLPRGDLVQALLSSWSVVPHACLFRRGIVERCGGFPEDLRVGEDQLMFLRCLLAGARVVHSPGTLELYRTENMDKITASADGHRRRITEWARFLVSAGQECQAHGIDPRKWFGFRLRAWICGRDMAALNEPPPPDVVREVAELSGQSGNTFLALADFSDKKYASIQSRLLGRRGHRSFRMGRLSHLQMELIGRCGYSLQ